MISLSFQTPHRSIVTLPPVQLPDFTILTGVNGSGKSHLLEAIYAGHVIVNGIAASGGVVNARRIQPKPTTGEIRLFTWSTLVPENSKAADPGQLMRARETVLRSLTTSISGLREQLKSAAFRSFNALTTKTDYEIADLNSSDVEVVSEGAKKVPEWWDNFVALRQKLEVQAINQVQSQSPMASAFLK